jgi:hypothetical protein
MNPWLVHGWFMAGYGWFAWLAGWPPSHITSRQRLAGSWLVAWLAMKRKKMTLRDEFEPALQAWRPN